jgi:DNA-binding NtrC family response regulator
MTEPTAPPVVLVVDDEESIRTALQRHLARTGFTVRTAGSAGEALDQLRGRDTALLLSDIRMPGMSGIELVSAALAVDPDLAIVMMSAVNDATTASLCIQRGAMDYITKPFDLTEVGRALLRALRRREALLAGAARRAERADVASPVPICKGAGPPGAHLGRHARGPGQRPRGERPLHARPFRPHRGPVRHGRGPPRPAR